MRWIAGAGLDVLAQEPPGADNPLLTCPNVILTPHVAAGTRRLPDEDARRICQHAAGRSR